MSTLCFYERNTGGATSMQDEIELLHMILKNCFGNIFVIDKDANIVYVNDNAANALEIAGGRTDEDECL